MVNFCQQLLHRIVVSSTIIGDTQVPQVEVLIFKQFLHFCTNKAQRRKQALHCLLRAQLSLVDVVELILYSCRVLKR